MKIWRWVFGCSRCGCGCDGRWFCRGLGTCSVQGCRHAGQQYVVTETAFGGIAFTKRLVVLCPQHGFARALVDGAKR